MNNTTNIKWYQGFTRNEKWNGDKWVKFNKAFQEIYKIFIPIKKFISNKEILKVNILSSIIIKLMIFTYFKMPK
jgi:hypothetical protein